jgi:prevent-host-death family protein
MPINLQDNVKPVSYVKTNTSKAVKYVNESKCPMVITQKGEARAVLIDIETYRNTENAFALMNIIKLAEKDIKDGKVKEADEVFKDIRKRISEDT